MNTAVECLRQNGLAVAIILNIIVSYFTELMLRKLKTACKISDSEENGLRDVAVSLQIAKLETLIAGLVMAVIVIDVIIAFTIKSSGIGIAIFTLLAYALLSVYTVMKTKSLKIKISEADKKAVEA